MIFSRHETDQLQRDLVWPRQRHELVPPSSDHLRDVEARQEGDGDQVAEPAGVDAEDLEGLSGDGIGKEDVAVQDAEQGVGGHEHEQVVPDELEDAALPLDDDAPQVVHALRGVLVDVEVNVLTSCRVHLGYLFELPPSLMMTADYTTTTVRDCAWNLFCHLVALILSLVLSRRHTYRVDNQMFFPSFGLAINLVSSVAAAIVVVVQPFIVR